MELLNEMNEKMHYEFSAIQCYIEPNGHPMSMTLEDISDDSEYTIDDRKYYSQTFKIKVRGYIIRREDYKVERIPSRFIMSSHDSDAAGIVNRRGKNRREDEKVKFIEEPVILPTVEELVDDERCETPIPEEIQIPSELHEETDEATECCVPEESRYYRKLIKIIMTFDDCTKELSFQIDKDVIVQHMEVENVLDFKIFINGEEIELEEGYKFQKDDEIAMEISREDEYAESEVTIVGYDPETAFDKEKLPEVSIDEKPDEEHILINPKE